MTAPTLRAAVIGLGWAGSVHARALARMPGVDLVALADPDPARRGAFPAALTVSTVTEVLARHPHYCVLATPTTTHETIAVVLAEAGIPTLIEKPLAPTLQAAARIQAAFDRAGTIGAVGHCERHTPAVAELARLLYTGQYGDLWQITARRQGPHPGRISDVGVVCDLMVHDLDLVAWLTGQPITEITATTNCINGDHEDTATATVRSSNGALAHLHADWITPGKRRILDVYTWGGVLTADLVNNTLTLLATTTARPGSGRLDGTHVGQLRRLHVPPADPPFTVENRIMRDTLRGEPTGIPATLAEGTAAVAATDAVLAAAASGRTTAVQTALDKVFAAD